MEMISMKLYLINNEYYVVEKDTDKALLRFKEHFSEKIIDMKCIGEEGVIFWKGDRRG
jgi:hypothetical protein